MNPDLTETSFKEVLLVPEGPPEAVWERAMHAAYAVSELDLAPRGDARDAEAPGMEVDPVVDLLLDEVDDPAGCDSDQTTPDRSFTTLAWAAGDGSDVNVHNAGYGEGLPENDDNVEY